MLFPLIVAGSVAIVFFTVAVGAFFVLSKRVKSDKEVVLPQATQNTSESPKAQ